jgi:HEAT repeat protein
MNSCQENSDFHRSGERSSWRPLGHRYRRSLWLLLVLGSIATPLRAQVRVRLVQKEPNAPAATAWDPAAVLAAKQVPGTPAGAAELIRRLSTQSQRQTEQWLRELADDDYFVREAAMQGLIQLPTIPREDWLRRMETVDAETRWRLKVVLDRHESESTQIYRAALQILSRDPSVLRDDDWLAGAVLLERADLRDEYSAFLRQHVPPQLIPRFRAAAADERPAARLAAAVVLGRNPQEDDQPVLAKLLGDTNDNVALLAAQGIAQRGDARALPVLIRLLDSPHLDVRRESVTWLCGLTGQEFDYSPHAPAAERQATIEQWRTWLAGPGARVAIQPPQRMAVQARGHLGNHLLISTGGLGKICEFDEQGETVWQYNVQSWSAEKLVGGNVLVASHWESRVFEVDRRGEIVWQLEGVNAIRAKPLPGGRVLIADFAGNRVVEADRRGAIVWQHETPDQCFDVERLVSGNTIYACPNLIREVSPDGSSVRQWTVEGRINSLQVLPTGRLLVSNYGQGRVVELDDEGKVMWEYKIPRPSDAFRLPGGRTLITTAEQIVEVDLQGQQIRQIATAVNGGARQ